MPAIESVSKLSLNPKICTGEVGLAGWSGAGSGVEVAHLQEISRLRTRLGFGEQLPEQSECK